MSDQQDILVPTFDSASRKSPIVVATFNLVATIVGGGVLSLPLAFAKTGVLLGSALMIFAAFITDRSLYLLSLCARQTGASSYGEVGKHAFGARMEYFISLLIFTFLLFVLVAYMVLVRDIWTPIFDLIFHEINGDLVLLAIVLMMSPFLVQKSLHALRFNCYIGFASVSILCMALCHHAWISPAFETSDTVLFVTDSFQDILFSFPIITLSFLSHFNILPIQSALVRPNRTRIMLVIDGAVMACFALQFLFGLGGYLYAGLDTKGNILLNCDLHQNVLFLLGRVGCGITLMLAMPMMLLPCRDSILDVLNKIVSKRQNEEHFSLTTGTLPPSPRESLQDNQYVFYGSTIMIATGCYFGAVAAPDVARVWSLCGSSMAFLIAFILPSACYLELQRRSPSHDNKVWIVFSWALLVFSVISAIACTIQTL